MSFPENKLSQGKAIARKNLRSHVAGRGVHGFIGCSTCDSTLFYPGRIMEPELRFARRRLRK